VLPTLVLVGRPNVGKSTLFNRLTRSRDAIVADLPGLTRDRHFGRGRRGDKPFLVVDTGGLAPAGPSGILREMQKQTRQAIDEADAVLFMVDARAGLTGDDRTIAQMLRESGRPLTLVANKAEGMSADIAGAEFHALGLGAPVAVSAAHGDGVEGLLAQVLADFPDAEAEPQRQDGHPCIAVVGRPNAGKSTLVNCLLGEARMLVYGEPGTTRDSIAVDFERAGRGYTLIDTAGLRRRGRVFEAVEKFSVIKTLQAIEQANVVLLVLDASQEISDQDTHIAGHVLETGRAVVVAVNKWDIAGAGRERIKRELTRKLGFLDFADTHYISALHGTGVGGLLRSVDAAFAAAMAKLSTPRLTRCLQAAVTQQQPPRAGLSRPKLRYAHQGGTNPPLVVVHGTALDRVPASYWRYLAGFFRREFKLEGTPLKVEYKRAANPYAGPPQRATGRRR